MYYNHETKIKLLCFIKLVLLPFRKKKLCCRTLYIYNAFCLTVTHVFTVKFECFQAFRYTVGGYEALVGPVKGVHHSQSPKAVRGHSLLVRERPAVVTILALVRDAVAR